MSIKKLLILLIFFVANAMAFHQGIYVTQSNALDTKKLNYFIAQAKKHHIDTFVIDISTKPNKTYAANIAQVIQNGILYVARVVVFPHGATHEEVRNQAIWEKRLALAQAAADLGAHSIQLDYIRYRSAFPKDPQKAREILKVIQYFRKHISSKVQLQLDVFGIAAHGPAHTIGQDPQLFASSVDAFCPMVYPSHYEPFRHHATRPYETVFDSISALKSQMTPHQHISIYAFIELYNYRFFLSRENKIQYIKAEIKATKDAGADGWYAWSPNNHYDVLFQVL
ncbi:MAG: hypothetical protein ACD_42C00558G0001 [uncultured bacterium]|nr:MAG: hypothetical protein ACD_42C00558G0001 [uncultured bacterium]OGT25954.1 MAG: hypothetical protein A3B71_07895 [Gammaproteobacteria bacterium RIFCSPHIGHO2_02_FULL_42_43]OGT52339.1 MAG: hypothetical protein A3E54_01775 [Gammaproteobacteria bacterium RIFCSPHIGHO2_12_FULL_41_25]OGT61950.1 MAG: hypothetical protein A3I77_01710 [Gammaproteobacteria bacterium RIFCSPLOWO2_02_FULL_42_14]OGT86338.1 MAG: hypothetical protein A3G86_07380 [Gammaproteobacteria bacterium RIFCSPLOWO2_12_FULL_42_18]